MYEKVLLCSYVQTYDRILFLLCMKWQFEVIFRHYVENMNFIVLLLILVFFNERQKKPKRKKNQHNL